MVLQLFVSLLTLFTDGGDAFEEHDSSVIQAISAESVQPFLRTATPSSSDPWAPLDPHHANAADNKPLKRGKTWREPKLPTSLLPVPIMRHIRVGLPKVTNFNTPCFGCSQNAFASLRLKAAAKRLQDDAREELQQEHAMVAEDVVASAQDWNAPDDPPFHEDLDSEDESALPLVHPKNLDGEQVPSHQENQADLVIDDMHSFQARCRSYM